MRDHQKCKGGKYRCGKCGTKIAGLERAGLTLYFLEMLSMQNHANFVRAGSSTAVQRLFICVGWRSKKTRLATNLEVDNLQIATSLTTICDSSGLHLMVFLHLCFVFRQLLSSCLTLALHVVACG